MVVPNYSTRSDYERMYVFLLTEIRLGLWRWWLL